MVVFIWYHSKAVFVFYSAGGEAVLFLNRSVVQRTGDDGKVAEHGDAVRRVDRAVSAIGQYNDGFAFLHMDCFQLLDNGFFVPVEVM